jgi:hypothetical protein
MHTIKEADASATNYRPKIKMLYITKFPLYMKSLIKILIKFFISIFSQK